MIVFFISFRLSEDERLAYLKNYTDSLRIAAEEQEKAAKEAQELQERLAQTSTMSNNNSLTYHWIVKRHSNPINFIFITKQL